jgi:Ca2+-transporting ATPase
MYLIGAVILGFILQLGVIEIPVFAHAFKVQNLSVHDWGLVLLFSIVPFILNEISKLFISESES